VANKVKYLLDRNGRYYARLVVPALLRPYLDNKRELRMPLGADYRLALKALHGAVADLQFQIRQAEVRAAENGQAPRSETPFPLSVGQLAHRLYTIRLGQDEKLRQVDARYASMTMDDLQVLQLKRGYGGQSTDDELRQLVGDQIDYFRSRGHTDAIFGSKDWRVLAIALCAAEFEAMARTAERDEGDFGGQPSHPLLTSAEPVIAELPRVSLTGLFDDYISSRKLLGKGAESERRWDPVFRDLRKFLRHDDARRLTKKDVLNWRDQLLQTRSPKTVRDVWLTALRTVLNWAVREDRISQNVAADVRQDVQARKRVRERGYTDVEAARLLNAVNVYERGERESQKLADAKRWVPILAAFTGARVTELTQLRKQDVVKKDGRWTIRITPDAGSVKTNQFRDVPLHRQIINLGFVEFVEASPSGALFYDEANTKNALTGARVVSGRISSWLNGLGVVPAGVAPNHGWRHRFKTVGRELGYSDRVVDAICGHASRTSGDDYGEVTLVAKARVIDAMRDIPLLPSLTNRLPDDSS
jgi:integrase